MSKKADNKCRDQETCLNFSTIKGKEGKIARKKEVCVYALYEYPCKKKGPQWWNNKKRK